MDSIASRIAPVLYAQIQKELRETERKHKEEELHKVNRTLRALSESDRAMLHGTNETEFLKDICEIVVKDCGHVMVWIGFAEEDEGKTVRPVASAGYEKKGISKR